MSIETMTKLATYTLGSTSATITFENIPQTYTDLKLIVSARGDTTNSDIGITGVQTHYLRINGNLGTLHTSRYLYGNGATATSGTVSGETIWRAPGSTNSSVTASTFSNSELYIANYTNNNYKTAGFDMVTENNSTTAGQFISAFLYAGTEPITKIEILTSSGNFVANSTFTLYGIKAMRTAVGSSIKATGGNISFDGTYVTHTFNTTDSFIPTQPILADYLVIAGGGGGGATYGAGGGAGGYLTSTGTQGGGGSAGSALYLTSGLSYTVTVGAGGAAGVQGTNNGSASNGSNSTFLTITSTGGGGGAGNGNASAQNAGGDGGSSGGGTYVNGAAGTRTASPVQGYNGGAGPAGFFGGGGGGGAGGAGASGAAATDCAGGAGLANSITGSSVTRAGGGGAYLSAGGLGGGGLGGGVGSPGQTNTGGGGGGSTINQLAGAGGSGVVIIRYRA